MLSGANLFSQHFLLYNRLCYFSCNYRSFCCFRDNSTSNFLFYVLLMSLMHKRKMFFVDDFFCFFMNNWNMFLVNMFLVNNRLDVFVDNWSMMLMNQIFMSFLDDILVMFMDYILMRLSNDRSFHYGINDRPFFMSQNLGNTNIWLKKCSFFMPDYYRCLGGCSTKLRWSHSRSYNSFINRISISKNSASRSQVGCLCLGGRIRWTCLRNISCRNISGLLHDWHWSLNKVRRHSCSFYVNLALVHKLSLLQWLLH